MSCGRAAATLALPPRAAGSALALHRRLAIAYRGTGALRSPPIRPSRPA